MEESCQIMDQIAFQKPKQLYMTAIELFKIYKEIYIASFELAS